MTQNEKDWFNLFLAVEDLEKIKKSFQNKTVIELQNKIINLHIALNKKVEKNKNQALEITKLLEQKKVLQTIANVSQIKLHTIEEQIKKAYLDRDFAIAFNQKLKDENSFVKSEHNKIIEKLNESRKETTISEDIRYNLEKKLKEKDTIISYLESKLK